MINCSTTIGPEEDLNNFDLEAKGIIKTSRDNENPDS